MKKTLSLLSLMLLSLMSFAVDNGICVFTNLNAPTGSQYLSLNISASTEFGMNKMVVEDAEIIVFADQETKRICVENWDTNNDGELSIAEAEAVTSLGNVFKNSRITSFNELKYFKGLAAIGLEAFMNSTVIKLKIPDNVTTIKRNAFRDCKSLLTLHIPTKVIEIEQNALSGCTLMTSITVDENNPAFCDIDGVLFTKDRKTLRQFPAARGYEPQEQSDSDQSETCFV